MRRLSIFLIVIFLFLVMMYDIKVGTIPHENNKVLSTPTKATQKPKLPYKELKVKSGDTVLSVVEDMNNGWKNTSIKQIIADFKLLNPDTEPTHIIVGKTYRFPLYE